MRISAKTKICLIIGDPIEHSLSPVMHNIAYKKLGIDNEFVYLGANVKVENIAKVVVAMRVMNWRGLTCTIPHKVAILPYLDVIDPIAKKIGAVNTVVNENGLLKGYNTDWLGAIIPLEKITNLKNKKVAVLGAGGAARAIVYGLLKKNARVKIYNRTLGNALKLAHEFHCAAKSIEEAQDIKESQIIINASSIGMKPWEDAMLIPEKCINKGQIIFDIVYKPQKTKLLQIAEKKGATVIYGLEMLLYQGTAQFELYTGKKAPVGIMRKTLVENLKK